MEQNKQITVLRDNEPDYNYMPTPPSHLEALQTAVTNKVTECIGSVALQARMAAYDSVHGTHYRVHRNRLVRQERNRAFADSIGLITIQ